MNRNEILIFTPTYNEAENIRSLIEQLLNVGLPADILVVDDNSPDGTGDIVAEMMRTNLNLKLLSREGKQGIGSAHLTALRYAKAQGYRLFVSLDADYSHKPEDIPRLLELKDTYDIVAISDPFGAFLDSSVAAVALRCQRRTSPLPSGSHPARSV